MATIRLTRISREGIDVVYDYVRARFCELTGYLGAYASRRAGDKGGLAF